MTSPNSPPPAAEADRSKANYQSAESLIGNGHDPMNAPSPSATEADRLEDVIDPETGMSARQAAKHLEEYPDTSAEEILKTEWCCAVVIVQVKDCPNAVLQTLYRWHTSRSARVAEQLAKAEQDNRKLRELLLYSHDNHPTYTDDGELQCSTCGIDFKRATVDEIQAAMLAASRKAFEALPDAERKRIISELLPKPDGLDELVELLKADSLPPTATESGVDNG